MKSYILDANALIVLFEGRSGADTVQKVLDSAQAGKAEVFMSAITVGEILAALWKYHGEAYARKGVQMIVAGPIKILDVELRTVLQAAEIRAKFHTGLGDSFVFLATVTKRATLVTADSGFRHFEHQFKILWLPAPKTK